MEGKCGVGVSTCFLYVNSMAGKAGIHTGTRKVSLAWETWGFT